MSLITKERHITITVQCISSHLVEQLFSQPWKRARVSEDTGKGSTVTLVLMGRWGTVRVRVMEIRQ